MAGFANTEDYESMIQSLQKYMGEMQEECAALSSAAEDCVDNTDGDPAAAKSAEKLQGCVSKINSALESIGGVMQALQNELNQIEEAASKA